MFHSPDYVFCGFPSQNSVLIGLGNILYVYDILPLYVYYILPFCWLLKIKKHCIYCRSNNVVFRWVMWICSAYIFIEYISSKLYNFINNISFSFYYLKMF